MSASVKSCQETVREMCSCVRCATARSVTQDERKGTVYLRTNIHVKYLEKSDWKWSVQPDLRPSLSPSLAAVNPDTAQALLGVPSPPRPVSTFPTLPRPYSAFRHRPSPPRRSVTAQARLGVPSPPILPPSRDWMPTTRPPRRSARAAGLNFRSATADPPRTCKASPGIKRSTRREKKVTKTLAIVLGTASTRPITIMLLYRGPALHAPSASRGIQICRAGWGRFWGFSPLMGNTLHLCG